jgi:hypothetical protein
MSTIYVPGRGAMDLDCRRVDIAVNEYDERLFAARHPRTNIPSVFVKVSPFTDWLNEDFGVDIAGQRAMPVLAFPEGWPSNEVVLRKLIASDAKRRGTAILDEINDKNAQLRRNAEYIQQQAAEAVAEVQESFEHRQGLTKYSRSLPKRDPKQRGGR